MKQDLMTIQNTNHALSNSTRSNLSQSLISIDLWILKYRYIAKIKGKSRVCKDQIHILERANKKLKDPNLKANERKHIEKEISLLKKKLLKILEED